MKNKPYLAKMVKGSLMAVALIGIGAWQVNAQWVAINDHAVDNNTANSPNPNIVTFYSPFTAAAVSSGPLKDLATGNNLPVTLAITSNAGTGGTAGAPAAGTPANTLFSQYVYFGTAGGTAGGGHAIQVDTSGLTEYIDYTFTGLNPGATYRLQGTGIRAGSYGDRWILCELQSADSFVPYNTPGVSSDPWPNVLTTTEVPAILANQVALNSGDNDDEGSVIGWDQITAGADGTFTVHCVQYTGTVPNGGSTAGNYGYGLVALRLEEMSSVPTAISITNTNLPANDDVLEGQTVTLGVAISGSTPQFQWYKNNAPLAGANGGQLVIPNATPANNGSYFAVVSNNINAVTSRVALISVEPDLVPPFVSSAVGFTETEVAVTFTEPVDPVTGANAANYVMTPQGGGTPLVISGAAVNGAIVTLTLAAPRNTSINYTLDVSGVRDNSYTKNLMIPGQVIVPAATSFVVFNWNNVWRYDPTDTDLGATWRATGFDDSAWPTAPGWIGHETTAGTITTLNNVVGPQGADFNPYAQAKMAYYFRTTFTIDNPAGVILIATNIIDDGAIFWINGQYAGNFRMDGNITTAGDPNLVPYSASVAGAAPEGELNSIQLPSNLLVAGQNVLAVEVHQSGTTSSDVIFAMKLMRFIPQPVSIDTQPASTNILEGQTLTLSVGVSGEGALYQWYFNNGPLASENSGTLTISNALAIHSGNYFVVVSNSVNAATSTVAAVTVTPDLVKPRVVYAELMPDGVTALVRFSEPVNQAQAENLANYTISGLSLFSAYLTNGTDLMITHNARTVVQNHTLTIGGIADLAPTPNTMNSTSLLMHVGFAIFGGITVPWYYNTSGQNLGTNWYAVNYADEQTWPMGEQVFYAGEDPATKQWPFSGNQLALNVTSTYFRVHFNYPYDPAGATLRLQLAVDDGCVIYLNGREATRFSMPAGPVTANTFATSHEAPNGDPSQWDVVEIPTTYLVQGDNVLAVSVHQVNATSTDIVFGAQLMAVTWPIGLPVPARLTSQPQSATINQGSNVTFTATAAGTAPLQYQWYFNNAIMSGQTTATLSINNAQAANEGNYTIVVRNSAGSVTSQVATLTVLRVPVITTQPQAASVAVGGTATFSVVAEGSMPLTYQWYFNTVAYPGKTNDTLVLNNVQPGNAGDYYVRIVNAAGSATSAVVRLTVTQEIQTEIKAPAIVGGQISMTVETEVGKTYTLQYTPTLNPINWQDVPGQSVLGDGTVQTLGDSNISQAQRYYRLKVD